MVETTKSDGVNSSQPLLRVLILEDSLRDAKLIVSALEGGGFRVHHEVTDSPETFRENLEKAEYDLILADFNLRNWNAKDAIEILKRSEKDIPLIVVTGSLGDESAVDCIKLGAADFVLKDRPARLPAAVQRSLEDKRLRTENKRAEEAARETSRRLQVLMGNLPGMAYRCRNTPEWPMEFVSEGCLALTGYTPEEMTNHAGIEYGNLIHPEDQDAVSREVEGAVRSGRPFQLEYRITTKDGRLVHVWEQGLLFAGPNPGEQWLEGFITDITPRKQAEIELHRVNRALRTITHCNEVLVRATEESHLLEDICGILVHEGGYRMAWVGFAENDEGKLVRPVAHAGFEEEYLQTANITWADTERGRGPTGTAIRTGKPVVARNIQTDSHLDPWREEQLKRGYASSVALPIFLNDQVLGGLTIYAQEADAFDSAEMQLLMDLSNDLAYGIQTLRAREERQRAEEDLRLAQFSVDHASDSVIWSDIQSRIIYANETACRDLGRPLEELRSLTIPEIDPLFPKEGWGTYWQTLRTLGTLTFETQCISKLGGVLTLEVTANYQEFNGKGYSFAFGRNITERKQAEEALRESEERFRATFENAGIGMALLDLQGRPFKSNPTLRQVLGYSEEELGRMVFTEFTHLDDRELDWRLYTELTAGKREKYEVEKRYLKKGGGEVWGLMTASLARGTDGRPVCAIGMVQDITERKQAEARLKESEEKFRKAFRTGADAFYIATLNEGLILEVNDRFQEVFGYGGDEAIGRTSLQLDLYADPVDRARLVSGVKSQGHVRNMEMQARRKGGELFPLLISVNLLETSGEMLILGVVRDITVQKRAEEALRESERKYRQLHESMRDGFGRADMDGRLIEVNDAFCKIVGYTAEELSKLTYQDLTPERWRTAQNDIIEKEVLTRGYSEVYEKEYQRKDGTIIPVELRTYLILDDSGNPSGMWAVVRDITERKWAERMLQEYERVVEGTDELIVVVDRNYRHLLANRAFLDRVGLEREDVVGCLVSEVMGRELFERVVKEKMDEGFQGKVVRYEAKRQYPKLGERDIFASYFPIEGDHGVDRLACVMQDITERKRAEEALRESERKFRRFAETITEVFWTADHPLTKLLYVSPSYERVWGRSCASLYENPGSFLEAIHPQDRERVLAHLAARKNSEPFEHEYRIVQPDGVVRWIWDRGFPAHDEPGGSTWWVGVAQDITERKQAEEALKENEEKYRSVVMNIPDVVWTLDMEGHIVFVTPNIQKLSGFTAEEVYRGGFDLLIDTMHSDDVQRIQDAIKAVFRDRQPRNVEYRGRCKNGEYIWVQARAVGAFENNGKWFAQGLLSDITERKRAEKAVLESEERYRTLFENAPVGIYRTTPDGHILAGNPALVRMLGYSSFEELAKCDLNGIYFDPEYPRSRFTSLLEERGEVAALESAWRKADGKILHIRENARAVRDASGKLLYYEGTVEDITERMRTEDEHVRLVTAIEQSAEAVVITDPQGTIEYVNPAFARITGYTRAEAMGQNPRILKSGNQDKAIYGQLWETILQGKPWHGEIINRRKDGRLYTEQMSVTPVRGARGDITHFIATKQDITARKQLELQVTQGQKMEAVGRLAGGVAHDFNNLLTIINGYAQLLTERSTPDDPSRSMFEEILTAGERAASLTRQLLAFSRRQVMEPRILDLNHVLADTEKMLRRLIGEDVDLGTKYEAALGRVKVDPGQIEQVIMNLAVNARDAMPEGGKLFIETTNVEVDEDYARSHPNISPGKYVMVAVSDTGCGMDKETQAHVFEPFFTTKERGKGTGLGLATVYGIIKQSGGFIWVYSEPGHGSTFKIYFPSVEEAVPTAEPAKDRAARSAKGTETIMVVEDEEGVRSLVCKALISKGYKVLEAEGAAAAMQIAEQFKEPIHLLLTDVVMPQTGGKALAMRLIALHPETKVLYMSGYTTDAIVRQGILEEGTFFLQKPFAPSALLLKVREVLNAKPGTQH